jgi:hypothetical protein
MATSLYYKLAIAKSGEEAVIETKHDVGLGMWGKLRRDWRICEHNLSKI